MSTHQTETRKTRPTNAPSSLLDETVNRNIFKAIGSRCSTLATAVVQVYLVDQTSENPEWRKHCTGVLTFIKDNEKRAYYLRVYSLKNYTQRWEQELHLRLKYYEPSPNFHSFEADACSAGLNFASNLEASDFAAVIQKNLEERIRKRKQRKDRGVLPSPRNAVAPSGPAPPLLTPSAAPPGATDIKEPTSCVPGLSSSHGGERSPLPGQLTGYGSHSPGGPSTTLPTIGEPVSTSAPVDMFAEIRQGKRLKPRNDQPATRSPISNQLHTHPGGTSDPVSSSAGGVSMFDQIRQGPKLKPISKTLNSRNDQPAPDGIEALLKEIQKGTPLKRVENQSIPSPARPGDALKDALTKKMDAIKNANACSDEGSDGGETDWSDD